MGKSNKAAARRVDSEQLVRQWALLRLLSDANNRAWSVKELAEQVGTTKATIQRDLATLGQDFSLIEEEVNKQKKHYRIDQKIRALESITFTPLELLAMFASQAALGGVAGPMVAELRSAAQKIRGFLSPRHNGGLDALARVFQPHVRGHVDYSASQEVIDDLVDAIARRRWCTLTYHAAWKGTTRQHRARPLRLVWHRSALYLLACLGEHQRITTLAVQRVRDLAVTDEPFPPPRLDVDGHIAKAYGIFVSDREEDVEIVFDAEIAWLIEERTQHPAETKERLPDGRLRYRLRSSAQWEIIPWVQSYGPLAELVAPAAWRAVIADNTRATAGRYGPKA